MYEEKESAPAEGPTYRKEWRYKKICDFEEQWVGLARKWSIWGRRMKMNAQADSGVAEDREWNV